MSFRAREPLTGALRGGSCVGDKYNSKAVGQARKGRDKHCNVGRARVASSGAKHCLFWRAALQGFSPSAAGGGKPTCQARAGRLALLAVCPNKPAQH